MALIDAPAELRGPPPAEAIAAWTAACGPAALPAETLELDDALGRIVARPVWARRSSPAFPAAAMDGIAVRAEATAGASDARPVRLGAAAFDVVDTGDPLPSSRDAVIKIEDVELTDGEALVRAPATPGRHVRPVGEDVAAGELLLQPGRRLGPLDLALAAAGGHGAVPVHRRPLVAILPTGDEIRPAGAELAHGEIADTNSIMLAAQAREAGCNVERGPIVADDPELLAEALRDAAGRADLVLVVAGTSAGRGDHAPDVLRRCGRIVVRGVAIRPGHPVVLAVVDGTPVMGCPGYPVSAALAFDELARPLLDRLSAAPDGARRTTPAEMGAGVGSKGGARELLRVALGKVGGRRVAVPLRRGASVLSALARADGLVGVRPAQTGIEPGARVRAEVLRAPAAAGASLLVAGAPDLAFDLLLLACAEEGVVATPCEMSEHDALALLARGGCHAAIVEAGAALPEGAGARITRIPLAEREIGLVVAPGDPERVRAAGGLLRPGLHIAAAPAAARLAPPGVGAIDPARSDAAAVDAVAGGHAHAALAGLPATRAAGAEFHPVGRAGLEVAILNGAAGEPAVRALLTALGRPALHAALAAAGFEPASGTRRAA